MKKFAPAVSTYSSQGHFCALKPQTHKWKYLTIKNTKAKNTPQRPPKNNTSKSSKVELVHKTKTKIILKVGHDCFLCGHFGVGVGSAQLYVPAERIGLKTLETCGFTGFSKTAKRGRF
jgi:hypothetical protein